MHPNITSLTDIQLMMGVRDGEVGKLAPLFERHHVKLYNYYVRLTGDRQLSEDMVQEVFLRIMKYRHTFRGEGQFTTWMFSIARNVQTDHWRRQRNDEPLIDPDEDIAADAFTGNESTADFMYDVSVLRDALLRLSPEKREALILSRYEGMKYTEIAKISGCSVETVKSRVHRGIRELRTFFFQIAGERR